MKRLHIALNEREAKLLLQHMRWEDVGKEDHANMVIAGIYDELKLKLVRMQGRAR